jgi:tetratricopeptide (TPR) repeat protein
MSTEAIVAHKVQLVDDLYVSDLLRVTLDAVLYDENQKKVARAGGDLKYDFLDLDPSYIISCALYAQSTGDWDWARTRYSEVMKLVRQMMDKDRDGCGLIEFEESGNYNSDRVIKGTHSTFNPANWWDAINFGHQDAYANALAYEALKRWGAVAETIGNQEDALCMKQKSEKLKKAFHEKLFNPATGIFAGWRSADGELHDYWFLFLNSIVIVYDMVDGQLAEDIMDRLLDKLHKVGFTNYRLGLPGNLSPIRKGDVRPIGGDRSVQIMCGRPALEDGSDAFQYYENGGASTRYMYYTLKALYKLKRFDEARRMLYPLLESYEAGEHAGIDVDGNSSDWTTWDGTACGYEGFAVGNFFPLINVLDELEARNEEAKQTGK